MTSYFLNQWWPGLFPLNRRQAIIWMNVCCSGAYMRLSTTVCWVPLKYVQMHTHNANELVNVVTSGAKGWHSRGKCVHQWLALWACWANMHLGTVEMCPSNGMCQWVHCCYMPHDYNVHKQSGIVQRVMHICFEPIAHSLQFTSRPLQWCVVWAHEPTAN